MPSLSLEMIASCHVVIKGLAANDATVTNPDNTCANGVIHVVDKVMLPPESDLLDMIRSDPDLR